MSRRNPRVLGVWGPDGSRVLASETQWRLPVKWNQEASNSSGPPPRVFCASIADVFEDWQRPMVDSHGRTLHVGIDGEPTLSRGLQHYMMSNARLRLWNLIKQTRSLRWLLLTKRPQNIVPMLPTDWEHPPYGINVYKHVWLGITVEDQQRANERIPILQAVPATVRFLSCEPLLERIDLAPHLAQGGIDWVIVGGESTQGGSQARPFDLSWAEEIVNDCRRFKVKCFVKQLGSRPVAEGLGILNRKGDRHGGTLEDWPEWLRVREVPES